MLNGPETGRIATVVWALMVMLAFAAAVRGLISPAVEGSPQVLCGEVAEPAELEVRHRPIEATSVGAREWPDTRSAYPLP